MPLMLFEDLGDDIEMFGHDRRSTVLIARHDRVKDALVNIIQGQPRILD